MTNSNFQFSEIFPWLNERIQNFSQSMRDTFTEIKESGLFKVIFGIIIVSIIGAIAVLFFEMGRADNMMFTNQQESWFERILETIWWAVITMTTVGYGDKVPITHGGRIIGILMAFSGVALVSIFTATISSVLVARKIKEGKGLQNLNIKNHILICGWNFNVEPLMFSLEMFNAEKKTTVVMINEMQEDTINDIILRHKNLNVKFVRGDFGSETVLDRANVKHANSAIVLPDASKGTISQADEKTLLAVLTLKSINPKIKVFAHVLDQSNVGHIRRANVDDLILSDEFSSFLLASHVMMPGVPQFLEALMDFRKFHKIHPVSIPSEFLGKPAPMLHDYFRSTQNAIFLGIVTEEKPIEVGDILSGDYSYLDSFIEWKLKQAGRSGQERQTVRVLINPTDDYIIDKKDRALILGEKVS
jgi:voltage-gated potassium channel